MTLEQKRLDAIITWNGDDLKNGLLTRRNFFIFRTCLESRFTINFKSKIFRFNLFFLFQQNNHESHPAFHAAPNLQRRRYLAGTVRSPRNTRENREQPLPTLIASAG